MELQLPLVWSLDGKEEWEDWLSDVSVPDVIPKPRVARVTRLGWTDGKG